jgi:hypothetical protein
MLLCYCCRKYCSIGLPIFSLLNYKFIATDVGSFEKIVALGSLITALCFTNLQKNEGAGERLYTFINQSTLEMRRFLSPIPL